jgi:hypothetical protein
MQLSSIKLSEKLKQMSEFLAHVIPKVQIWSQNSEYLTNLVLKVK